MNIRSSLLSIAISFLVVAPFLCKGVIESSPYGAQLQNERGEINADLLELIRLTQLGTPSTLDELVKVTQAGWFRGSAERWQLDSAAYSSLERQLTPIFKRLGLLEDQTLQQLLCPDYLVILGATVITMEARLLFAKQLIEKGMLLPTRVVILVGQRPLTDDEKADAGTLGIHGIETETDAAEALLALSEFKQFRDFLLDIIDTPGTYDEAGNYKRPTTRDTVVCWLKEKKPVAGSIVAVSSTPFVQSQDISLRRILPAAFTLITIGGQDREEESMAIFFDALAGWIYHEGNRRKEFLAQQAASAEC